jgi:Ca2+-binding EF-hand superfamily protein
MSSISEGKKQIKALKRLEEKFDRIDKNGDGKLSLHELENEVKDHDETGRAAATVLGDARLWSNVDADNDGAATKDELGEERAAIEDDIFDEPGSN